MSSRGVGIGTVPPHVYSLALGDTNCLGKSKLHCLALGLIRCLLLLGMDGRVVQCEMQFKVCIGTLMLCNNDKALPTFVADTALLTDCQPNWRPYKTMYAYTAETIGLKYSNIWCSIHPIDVPMQICCSCIYGCKVGSQH